MPVDTKEYTAIIQEVFFKHDIEARVTGSESNPRITRVFINLDGKTKIKQISNLDEEISLALSVNGIRVSRNLGKLSIEIRNSDVPNIYLDEVIKSVDFPKDGGVFGLCGMDLDGQALALRLNSSEVAHVLICGTTGSGKTELAKSLVKSVCLLNDNVELLIVDPKGNDFKSLDNYCKFKRATTYDVAYERLEWLVDEMLSRSPNEIKTPHLVFLIDELADFLQGTGKEALDLLTRLLQRGRSAGITVIACTQKPLASSIGSLIKANFPVKLVGKVTSPEESKVASGIADVGAEKLLGRGDFILVGSGETIRFQSCLI